jgi:hypothetical protein
MIIRSILRRSSPARSTPISVSAQDGIAIVFMTPDSPNPHRDRNREVRRGIAILIHLPYSLGSVIVASRMVPFDAFCHQSGSPVPAVMNQRLPPGLRDPCTTGSGHNHRRPRTERRSCRCHDLDRYPRRCGRPLEFLVIGPIAEDYLVFRLQPPDLARDHARWVRRQGVCVPPTQEEERIGTDAGDVEQDALSPFDIRLL